MNNREILFNEVSLTAHQIQNHLVARNCFEEFVGAVGKLIESRLAKPVLRSQLCLQEAEIPTLNEGVWRVADWLCDQITDRDRRNFILTLVAKIPIESGIGLSAAQEDALIGYEYRVSQSNGPNVFAFGVALQTDNVVASVPTCPMWVAYQVDTYVCDADIVISRAVVDHISREEHCDSLAKIFIGRCLDSLDNAVDFRKEKGNVFPNLLFSPDIDDQVADIEPSLFPHIMARLVKMNETAEQWRSKNQVVPEYRFQWRPESTSTMNNQTFRDARKFRMPNGGEGIFEKHLDFSDRHRIHFIEDRETKTFIIGYIGNHLPTTKFVH